MSHKKGICVEVDVNESLGLMSVKHDGDITWDELQVLKNETWGEQAVAIEVYPPEKHLVNNGNWRHLWLLGRGDWWPNLTSETWSERETPLKSRFNAFADRCGN